MGISTANVPSLWYRRPITSGFLFLVFADILLLILLHISHPSLLYDSPLCRTPTAESIFLGPHARTFVADSVPDAVGTKQADKSNEYESLLDEAHLTSNGGFLMLRENEEKSKHFGVSMFHQLHCIEMLRDAIRTKHETDSEVESELHVHGGERLRKRGGLDTIKHTTEGIAGPRGHLFHCLDYIAQGVVCAADDTIEPSFVGRLPSGERVRVVDGLSTVHQCRDSALVHKAMLQSQVKPLVVNRELRSGDTLRSIQNR